ncbi:hypothetical protein [Streptomyces sp. TRM70350]|nr:hypothetical protein [Streptomyces sp. TRM70350]
MRGAPHLRLPRLGQVRAMCYGVGLFVIGLLVGFAAATVPGTAV